MGLVLEDVLVRDDPVASSAPLVVDCPFAGRRYPAEFVCAVPAVALRAGQDLYLEEVVASAPEFGATLLYPLVARRVVDVTGTGDGGNRPADGEWIDRYRRPYRYQLDNVLDGLRRRYGAVWHLRCVTTDLDVGDFSVTAAGDAGGMGAFLAGRLRALGYKVTESGGAPVAGARGVRFVCLTVARRLYLDDDSERRPDDFARLRDGMTAVLADICDFTVAHTAPSEAAE